jgi:hypothetical protein
VSLSFACAGTEPIRVIARLLSHVGLWPPAPHCQQIAAAHSTLILQRNNKWLVSADVASDRCGDPLHPAFLASSVIEAPLGVQLPQPLLTAQNEGYVDYAGRYTTPSQSSTQRPRNIGKCCIRTADALASPSSPIAAANTAAIKSLFVFMDGYLPECDRRCRA